VLVQGEDGAVGEVREEDLDAAFLADRADPAPEADAAEPDLGGLLGAQDAGSRLAARERGGGGEAGGAVARGEFGEQFGDVLGPGSRGASGVGVELVGEVRDGEEGPAQSGRVEGAGDGRDALVEARAEVGDAGEEDLGGEVGGLGRGGVGGSEG
jgi:hypothetical protein